MVSFVRVNTFLGCPEFKIHDVQVKSFETNKLLIFLYIISSAIAKVSETTSVICQV